MGEILRVLRAAAALTNQFRQPANVGDRFQVAGRLFAAESPIQVRAESDVKRVASHLANVINVVDRALQAQMARFGRRLAPHPVRNEHPAVKGHANHGVALDQSANLVVGELPLIRRQCAAVMMAGPDWAGIRIHRLPKTFVSQMGHIQDHAQTLHLCQQFAPARRKAAGRIGSLRVNPGSVMGRPDRAQSLVMRDPNAPM